LQTEYKPITSLPEQKKINTKSLTLENIITKSALIDNDQTKQAMNVVNAFNRGIDSKDFYIVPAGSRPGFRIPPDEFVLAYMNNIPELAMAKSNGESL